MNEVDRLKMLVRHLIRAGVAADQKTLGKLLGYENESYFSQIINHKVQTPKDFLEKLKSLDDSINIIWITTGEGNMLNSQNTTQINTSGDNIQGNSITINKKDGDMHDVIMSLVAQLSTNQQQISKNQEQIDRLITLIENKL